MNTNSNVYTVVYTAIVVVVVAAVLAFVSQKLGPRQAENEMAETVGQILTAAQFGKIEQWKEMGNAETIKFFENNVMENTSIASTSELKALNYKVKTGEIDDASLPEYTFRNGVTVIPVYGAGLWGPVWGYVAFDKDGQTIVGAYFDHASETPGLGGKIKDDPAFRDQFKGRKVIFGDGDPFAIVKGGAPEGKENAVDAITGATMTSKGLNAALVSWFNAYRNKLSKAEEE